MSIPRKTDQLAPCATTPAGVGLTLAAKASPVPGAAPDASPLRGELVADYRVADQATLRGIPATYIDTARRTYHVAYMHTSHGTHVTYGVYGLPDFKAGDDLRFGVTANAATPDPNKLDFHDYPWTYTPSDLSQADADWSAWLSTVRTYLDDPANADINLMMWSWCNIAGHDVGAYLSSMQTVIDEYGDGGAKIGSGSGATRTTPVTFIFMTGHANRHANTGEGNPRDQARRIIDYCTGHGYPCLDYYSIDTHAMDGTGYEDAGDNGDSESFKAAIACATEHHAPGNDPQGIAIPCSFYNHWQADHSLGVDWYENRSKPGGEVAFGAHTFQHITSNRKAYAFWYLLARLAGWH